MSDTKYEKSCGAIVFTRLNGEIKYILVKQQNGIYSFPKGHVENDETELETALREINEETGLNPRIIDGFKVSDEYPLPNKDNVIKQVVYFLAEYQNQQFTAQEGEIIKIALMSYDDALKVFNWDSQRHLLKAANDFLLNNTITN
ncbi:MAG TPA: NUDIX domain-containing protein [Clostridiaceae bacterium]|nr:NUDIX domain-containing protein [Clostridiaceae bacterium]